MYIYICTRVLNVADKKKTQRFRIRFVLYFAWFSVFNRDLNHAYTHRDIYRPTYRFTYTIDTRKYTVIHARTSS